MLSRFGFGKSRANERARESEDRDDALAFTLNVEGFRKKDIRVEVRDQFLDGQDFRLGQEHHLLRHAITAAQVAAVGD